MTAAAFELVDLDDRVVLLEAADVLLVRLGGMVGIEGGVVGRGDTYEGDVMERWRFRERGRRFVVGGGLTCRK